MIKVCWGCRLEGLIDGSPILAILGLRLTSSSPPCMMADCGLRTDSLSGMRVLLARSVWFWYVELGRQFWLVGEVSLLEWFEGLL